MNKKTWGLGSVIIRWFFVISFLAGMVWYAAQSQATINEHSKTIAELKSTDAFNCNTSTEQYNKIDTKLDKMNDKMDAVSQRLGISETKIDGVNTRVVRIEDKMDKVRTDLGIREKKEDLKTSSNIQK